MLRFPQHDAVLGYTGAHLPVSSSPQQAGKLLVTATSLAGLLLLEPKVFGDERGFFLESYNRQEMALAGITAEFVQDNHSHSARGVLRGLHYQIQQPQGKLVRVVQGEIFDVAVDLRRQSPTCGQWFGASLSAENKRMLWIPAGFAHGFVVTAESADVLYKATDFYAPQFEITLAWNDPAIGIDWPLDGEAIVSARDRQGLSLAQAPKLD